MKVLRDEFLRTLESVNPGLSNRDTTEQFSCFAFRNGMVFTYNDEVCCRAKTKLDKSYEGAVPAKLVLELLRKMNDEEINVDFVEDQLTIAAKKKKGRKSKAYFKIEKEIVLPIESVETPEEWKKLNKNFLDAISIVKECCTKENSKSNNSSTTRIHIHPKWIEGCDPLQLCRWDMKTRVDKPFLVKPDAVKHIVGLGMEQFAETPAWVHFKNSNDTILSCRRYQDSYPDVTQCFSVSGKPITLPRGLVEAVGKAELFSAENIDNNKVLVQLDKDHLVVEGLGLTGKYIEEKSIDYSGDPVSFMISPKILMDFVKRHTECEIAEKQLKVNTGQYQYTAFLSIVGNGKKHGD